MMRLTAASTLALLLFTASRPAGAQGVRMTQVAKGTFVVVMQPLPFEGAASDSKMGRMSIDKQISGDLTASTTGQMLTGMTERAESAGYVAIEHVVGTLHGRRGSFLLQHVGVMDRGTRSLRISVVPDSGTDELRGLAGEFTIENLGGQHSYEFRYGLPGA